MENNTLTHHGILGQKWGVRRFQNKDGSLTSLGKKHIVGDKEKQKELEYRLSRGRSKGSVEQANEISEKLRKKTGTKFDGVIDDRKEALKNRRTLSDAELNKRIERLQTEKRLKDLTEADLNPGRVAVKEILANSGKKVATAVVTGATLYAVKVAMTGKFDINEAAGYMTPKPKK